MVLKLSKQGTSGAPIVDLAGIRKARWVERYIFGAPWAMPQASSNSSTRSKEARMRSVR